MSHIVYNAAWQQAMEQLSDIINRENPAPRFDDRKKPIIEPSQTFSSSFSRLAWIYIQYVQVFRSLEDCYDQIIHPQKRGAIRIVLELLMGRITQLRSELLLFSSSQASSLSTPDVLHLESVCLQHSVSVKALEMPVPRYFREPVAHSESGNQRRAMVERLLEENAIVWGQALEAGPVSVDVLHAVSQLNILTREQAIKLIQKNERGRQGALRGKLMKELRAEDQRRREGKLLNPQQAATSIQATWRGYRQRKQVNKEREEELRFLGLIPNSHQSHQHQQTALQSNNTNVSNNPTGSNYYNPLSKESLIRVQRKARQLDASLVYGEKLVSLEQELEDEEGEEMKQAMWEERYQWWIQQKELTGEYPQDLSNFYKQKTATRAISQMIATTTQEQTTATKEERKETVTLAPAVGNVVGPSSLISLLSRCVSDYRTCWSSMDESDNPDQGYSISLAKQQLRPLIWDRVQAAVDQRLLQYFANVREKVAETTAASQSKGGKSKKKGGSKAKKDKKAKEAKADAQADTEAAKGPDGQQQSGANEESKQQIEGEAPSTESTKPSKVLLAADNKKGPFMKCCEGEKLCTHLPLPDMVALLIKMNILQLLPISNTQAQNAQNHQQHQQQQLPQAPTATTLKVGAIQGESHYNMTYNIQQQTALNIQPNTIKTSSSSMTTTTTNTTTTSSTDPQAGSMSIPLSFAHLRTLLTTCYILPQGSAYVKSVAPSYSSLLLFGPPGSGKTMASRIIAAESGSVWFDLSARNIEKKLGNKGEIAKLIHMIYTVALQLQPSVLYMDEVEKIFINNKTKKNNSNEMLKMKHLLMIHQQLLHPREDRVLLIGNSRCPYNQDRVDMKDLLYIFGDPQSNPNTSNSTSDHHHNHNHGKIILMPLPDRETRLTLFNYFIQQTGLPIKQTQNTASSTHSTSLSSSSSAVDLSLLAQVSEGYTCGAIQQAVLATLPASRVSKISEFGTHFDVGELLNCLSQTSYSYYVYKGEYQANISWLETVNGVRERRKVKQSLEAQERQKAASQEVSKDAKKKKAR